ncbi:MAG: hypothetical protein ACRC1K_22230, partial [Planctomycetia bacterium]
SGEASTRWAREWAEAAQKLTSAFEATVSESLGREWTTAESLGAARSLGVGMEFVNPWVRSVHLLLPIPLLTNWVTSINTAAATIYQWTNHLGATIEPPPVAGKPEKAPPVERPRAMVGAVAPTVVAAASLFGGPRRRASSGGTKSTDEPKAVYE